MLFANAYILPSLLDTGVVLRKFSPTVVELPGGVDDQDGRDIMIKPEN